VTILLAALFLAVLGLAVWVLCLYDELDRVTHDARYFAALERVKARWGKP